MRYKVLEDITTDDMWSIISSIYQSNSIVLNTEIFYLGVTSVKMPTVSEKSHGCITFDEGCARRMGIILINNKDNICLPRAQALAIAYKDPDTVKMRRDMSYQKQRALELWTSADVENQEGDAGKPELKKFQRHLKE